MQLEETWPFERDVNTPLLPPPRLAEIRAMEDLPRIRMYDGTSTVLLTSYSDVKELVQSAGSSADGNRPGFPYMSEASRANRGGQQSIDRMDPPRHDELRAMLAGFFSVKRMREVRPFLEETVDRLLDELEEKDGEFDFVRDFAEPLPALAIAKLLDLPTEDIQFFVDTVKLWLDERTHPDEILTARETVKNYFDQIIEQRGAGDGTDVLSKLVKEKLFTGKITREELLLAMQLFVKAGFDTSANMISLGTVALLEHPEQWQALVTAGDDPTIVRRTVEELLRYISVAQHSFMRITTEDVPVGHHVIPAETPVFASISAANHDPKQWEQPHILNIHRDARGHFAFGVGLHQCLGQALARAELQVVFEKLPKRFPNLQLGVSPEEVKFRDSVVYGVDALAMRSV